MQNPSREHQKLKMVCERVRLRAESAVRVADGAQKDKEGTVRLRAEWLKRFASFATYPDIGGHARWMSGREW